MSDGEEVARPENRVEFVAMRDGVRLCVDIYPPIPTHSNPCPALLHRTPYDRKDFGTYSKI
jgi:predicted acyl esterase